MVAGEYASLMGVKYPHDPERLDRWIGKHASIIQAFLALSWLTVALGSIVVAVWPLEGADRLIMLMTPVVWGLVAGFFGWWSYQEAGPGEEQDDGGKQG